MALPIPIPLINGDFYSYADIEVSIVGLTVPVPLGIYAGIKSINYGHKLGRAYVRGTNREPLGMSSGQYEPSADFEMFTPQANLFMAALGPGYMQVPFSVVVNYTTTQLGIVSDSIVGAYITEVSKSNSESVDATTVKFTLMPQRILLNGLFAVTVPIGGIPGFVG